MIHADVNDVTDSRKSKIYCRERRITSEAYLIPIDCGGSDVDFYTGVDGSYFRDAH